MPTPRKLSQQFPTLRAKARMQKPQGGGKFLVQIPGGARRDVMDEIDTCISRRRLKQFHWIMSIGKVVIYLMIAAKVKEFCKTAR